MEAIRSMSALPQRRCSNPICKEQLDADKAQTQIEKYGLVYADCGEFVIQGFKCPNPECTGLQLVYSSPEDPAYDMRNFVISPHTHSVAQVIEQIALKEDLSIKHEFLRFKVIPAWDEKVPFPIVVKSYQRKRSIFENNIFDHFNPLMGIPYKINFVEFKKRLVDEIETGVFNLRRLYPDTPKFRSLLTCFAPNKITKIDDFGDDHFVEYAEGSSAEEISVIKESLCQLFESAAGTTFRESVKQWLDSKGIHEFDEKEFDIQLYKVLDYREEIIETIKDLTDRTTFVEDVDKFLKPIFPKVLNPILTEVGLSFSRKDLIKWVEKVEKGKALLVDAPMGLGKTHSIVEALVSNQNLSAIIFMPTRKLCEDLVHTLKMRMAWLRKDFTEIIYNTVSSKREYLENEVYYYDGIKPNGLEQDGCINYDQIVQRYRQNWIKKRDLCHQCEKRENCRFLKHDEKAQRARIVVSTHQQYDHFYGTPGLHFWIKDGDSKIITKRDLVIVDEDIVISKCYQPIYLDKKEIDDFLTVITDFISNFDDGDEINDKLYKMFGQIGTCMDTSFVRPSDPKFEFPEKIKTEWKNDLPDLNRIIPDADRESVSIGNHLDIVEDGIRKGFVVQKIGNKLKVFFSNRKFYDLSGLPPHVFFDGTMLDEKFRKHKLRGVKFEKFEIKVRALWDLKVSQNINTDITKKAVLQDRARVQQLIMDLLKQLGPSKKYLFLCNKTTKSAYLERFLKSNFTGYSYKIGYFGNLRGINDAQDCDVGIMLGSYLPSDAVEIAMALDFIQNKLPEISKTKTENYFWVWEGSKGYRSYKEDYKIIEELAKANRLSEHRQALARTRYLFHDVAFYVLSKDRVADYESFGMVLTEAYRADLFPPRKERFDTKYDDVKKCVFDWLINHDTVNAIGIYRKFKIRRQTIGKYLKRMHLDGLLIKKGATTYVLPSPAKGGHPTL